MKQAGPLPRGGVTVELAAGHYARLRPLALTAEDSGAPDAPVTYRARPGQQVVLQRRTHARRLGRPSQTRASWRGSRQTRAGRCSKRI
jgi:hypothetical protein